VTSSKEGDPMRAVLFRQEPRPRRGFTIIEAVVTVAILGTMAALLLPAIQQVRAAARSATCRSHLHQIGVAIANCEQVEGSLPTYRKYKRFTPLNNSMASLLPYLEQRALWERLQHAGWSDQYVEVLLCPDDEFAWRYPGLVNYRWNKGVTFLEHDPDGSGIKTGWQRGLLLREIQDGLSNTAAMSERLIAYGDNEWVRSLTPELMSRDVRRYSWYTTHSYKGRGEEELAARICRTGMTTPAPYRGAAAIMFYLSVGGYTHLLPPNHRACYNAVDRDDVDSAFALAPPSSNHAGVAHLLMCDGQVRMVTESVDNKAWRAAGTRAGGEAESWK